jgi:small subunit ribosomal protein S5
MSRGRGRRGPSRGREFAERGKQARLEAWVPRTRLGKMIQEGKISSIEEVFAEGQKIKEPEIVDALIPDLQEEVININLVQKQSDAGEKSRFKAIVAVGNRDGYIGLGSGKAKQVRTAIEKASLDARLNVVLVRRGCGSWECRCGKPHSLPFQVKGKCGGVEILLVPGPRGVGVVASEGAKVILGLAGVKDIWTHSFGSTRTVPSFAAAVFDALRKTYSLVTPAEWVR